MATDPRSCPRIALCSWSLRPEDPVSLAAAVRRVGLDAVQLALGPVVESPDRWADAVRVLGDAGVTVVSGMLATIGEDYSTLRSIELSGGVRPDATWDATRDRAARVADVAAAARIPLVTFHAGFIPHERSDHTRALVLDRLRVVVDRFAEVGVATAFETGQESAATLIDALDELGRDVGVNFDPANMILYGMGDPVAALETLAPHIRQVHIKDALPASTPGEWGTEVPVGSGAVDWPRFLTAVRALPRRVDMVIEREAGEAREADIATAAAMLKQMASV